METPIIATKLNIPHLRSKIVSRPRLVDCLEQDLIQGTAFGRRLTLVSAPAGYGKTTLVVEWLSKRKIPAAWVSLDEADNDPRRFITYVIASLDQILPGIAEKVREILQSPQPPPDEILITTLVNKIAGAALPLMLVLDDYHAISTPAIHQQIAFLLDHQPDNLHLVITTREDPLLPVSRLRARGQVLEIHQTDLQFTEAETADFLNKVMGLQVTPDQVTALEHRTEGWIAGLQLAALSMQRRGDTSDFIQAFTGSNRFILDYLIEEVFEHQTPEVKDFLLNTSILEQLSAPLCNAVTGLHNSQEMLEAFEQANLFIVPLDLSRQWYRYHRLFSELLRHRLRLSDRSQEELHQKASHWFEANGLLDEAIQHSIHAQDWEHAGSLIREINSDYLKRGEVLTVVRWFQALPHDFLESHPQLRLDYCWVLLLINQFEAASPHLEELEPAGKANPEFLGEVYAAQAYLARGLGDHARMVERSQIALELLSKNSLDLRAIVAGNLGIAYWHMGKMEATEEVLVEALKAAEASGNHYLALTAMIFQGRVHAVRGQLHQANEWFQRAVDQGGEIPINALAFMDLAALNYEWNKPDQCKVNLKKAIDLCQRDKNHEFLVGCLMIEIRLNLGCGEMARAEEALAQVWIIVQDELIPASSTARVNVAQAALLLAQGKPASEWADKLSEQVDYHPYYRFLGITKARTLPPPHALGYLDGLSKAARDHGWIYALINIRILQASLANSPDQALSYLQEALTMAEGGGFINSFREAGDKIVPLLKLAVEHEISPTYAAQLLAAMNGKTETRVPDQPALLDPLSDREIEVLQLLASGMSNREIADQIVVSISTVKSHVHHICAKLDAANRTQAVARGRELGLL